MSYKKHTFVVAAVVVGWTLLQSSVAGAATLSYEQTAGGRTGSGQATSYLNLPVSDTYGRTFTNPTSQIGSTGFGFYDDFVFSVAAASADAITSTIDFANVLGINNLSVRLYSFNSNPTLPVLGAPTGLLVDGMNQTINIAPGTSQIISVLPETALAAGTYVLEVRGNVVGTGGGSYSGTLNLVPTPLPAALPLLLAGIGLFGASRRVRHPSV